MQIIDVDYYVAVFSAKSPDVATEKTPTLVKAEQTSAERDEADYAVIRPTDGANDDEYDYPASVPDDMTSRQYLTLLPEPEEQ